MSFTIKAFCMNCRMLLAFLLFFHMGKAQFPSGEVDRLIAARGQALGNKSVVLVHKGGKTIFQKETGEEFKVESAEPVGSASKWLTLALVMTFVEKGELSLDAPVSRYLPVFASYSKSYITIRHCLANVTGIESEQKKISRLLTKKKFDTLEEEVNYFAASKEIVAQPGTEFFYADAGINIVGRILEVISKRKSFSKLMQERITRPLGMKRTTFARETGSENPSAGAVSTAGDYMRFLVMLLNNGESNGKRILSRESILEMEKAQFNGLPVKSTPTGMENFHYGLGQWILETDGAGKSTVIACPGSNGTWPYIDRCRQYACIIFTPQRETEQDPDTWLEIKAAIDGQIRPECR